MARSETPITLDILHAQCDRLALAFPGASVHADRRLTNGSAYLDGRGYYGEYFYIALRYKSDRPGIGPYVHYVSVEGIDAAVAYAAEVK